MGVVEYRSGSHGELIATFTASELFARLHPPYISVSATWAVNSFWPTQPREDFAAIFISVENERFNSGSVMTEPS